MFLLVQVLVGDQPQCLLKEEEEGERNEKIKEQVGGHGNQLVAMVTSSVTCSL